MRRGNFKKILIGVVLLIAAGGVTWSLAARTAKTDSSYRLVKVQRGDVEAVVTATGNLQATKTVEVGTQVSGQIAANYVDFNDEVKKGQLISRIDPTVLQQQVLAGEANLQRSQADLDNPRQNLDREVSLLQQGLAAQTDYNTARYQYNVAQSALTLAKVNLETARNNLAYTEIRAPIDGVVIARNVDVGQTVAASLSAPTLFVIAQDLKKMQILASVDESDIGRVRDGQDVRFTVQSYPNATFSGKVSQVRLQSAVTENVVTYTVVVEVDNPDGRLLPGMTATVQIVVDRVSGVLKVPNGALRFAPSESAQPEAAERKAEAAGAASVASATSATGTTAMATTRGGSAGSGARRASKGNTSASDRGQLWYLSDGGKLTVAVVRKGITDGQFTEITGPDVKEGMQVIASVAGSAAATASSSPFQSETHGPRGPGPGM